MEAVRVFVQFDESVPAPAPMSWYTKLPCVPRIGDVLDPLDELLEGGVVTQVKFNCPSLSAAEKPAYPDYEIGTADVEVRVLPNRPSV